MTTTIARSSNTQRLRLQSTQEASATGTEDAQVLLAAIANNEEDDSPTELLGDALAGIISLAVDNRLDECQARTQALCEIIGPVLRNAVGAAEQLEALRAKCALLSASLRQAEEQANQITETEGGKL